MQYLAQEIAPYIEFKYWHLMTRKNWPPVSVIIDGDTKDIALLRCIKSSKLDITDLIKIRPRRLKTDYHDTLPHLYEKSDEVIKRVIDRIKERENPTTIIYEIIPYNLGDVVKRT